ncbi:MAG: S8 family serine peptidase [Acidobacteriota bacterium]
MLDSIEKNHNHTHAQNRFAVIPTAEKLGVDKQYSGRGVRIAFLDSGFYPHPDFASRVVAFHDISGEDKSLDHVLEPAGHHWHGTQTVTSCAGNGGLSDGVYRSLAHNAELVVVKVSRAGRISDAEIEDGLRWVIANHERFDIKILNMSLGGDCDRPTADSKINALVEELVASGVVVIVAAGNSAETRSAPPASAPSAITVGGYSDENKFAPDEFDLYHSSHGVTADGLVKPELIAPAMFVAAPILPGTPDYVAAELLSMLAAAPNYAFGPMLEESWQAAGLDVDVVGLDPDAARKVVDLALHRRKIVATHYKHVDGTSFAAPITASVVALMLEANPGLTPSAIKNILLSTASRLGGHPAIRQGFGVVNAAAAIELASLETHQLRDDEYHGPRIVGREIVLRYHDDTAHTVGLTGDFNDWRAEPFAKCGDGLWKIAIPCRPAGTYRYKFVVNDVRWTEDPSHGLKEEDGFGGFNSVFVIGT